MKSLNSAEKEKCYQTKYVSYCHNGVRGFSDSDLKCLRCNYQDTCQAESLSSLMYLCSDLNKNIFDILIDQGQPKEQWGSVGFAGGIENHDDSDFDITRGHIIYVLDRWFDSFSTNTEYIRNSLMSLRLASRNLLRNIHSGWMVIEDKFIESVHVADITSFDPDESERWADYTRIPYWISDNYMSKMTGDHWKVFCYIARRCVFDPNSPVFGSCLLSNSQISEGSGVEAVESSLRALKLFGLIDKVYDRNSYGEPITSNKLIYVNFFFQMRSNNLWK